MAKPNNSIISFSTRRFCLTYTVILCISQKNITCTYTKIYYFSGTKRTNEFDIKNTILNRFNIDRAHTHVWWLNANILHKNHPWTGHVNRKRVTATDIAIFFFFFNFDTIYTKYRLCIPNTSRIPQLQWPQTTVVLCRVRLTVLKQ